MIFHEMYLNCIYWESAVDYFQKQEGCVSTKKTPFLRKLALLIQARLEYDGCNFISPVHSNMIFYAISGYHQHCFCFVLSTSGLLTTVMCQTGCWPPPPPPPPHPPAAHGCVRRHSTGWSRQSQTDGSQTMCKTDYLHQLPDTQTDRVGQNWL